MKEREETILLRKLLEEGDMNPAPDRIDFYAPHYEMVIGIGKDYHAKVIIDKEAYIELLENDDYSK